MIYQFGEIVQSSTSSQPPWLYDHLMDEQGSASVLAEALVVSVRAAFYGHFKSAAVAQDRWDLALSTACRLTMPRSEVDRLKLMKELRGLANAASPKSHDIESKVDDLICTGRRHWKRLPSHLSVRAHVTCSGSSALFCREVGRERDAIWIEGILSPRGLICFDQILPLADNAQAEIVPPLWSATIYVERYSPEVEQSISWGGGTLTIPAMRVVYRKPARHWQN